MSAKRTPRPSPASGTRAPAAKKTARKRTIVRVEPFSPWQKLVVARMAELSLSTRDVAAKIRLGDYRPEHSTIWAWTKCKDGYPPKETYASDVNARLAKALEIEPEVLAKAYEDSRRHLILSRDATQRGPLSVLRTLFFESSRKTWTKAEIIGLIDQVQGQ